MHHAYGIYHSLCILQFAGDLLDTGGADILSLEGHDITRISAKNAAGLVFFENDHVVLCENFQRVIDLDTQYIARFHRNGYPSELIDATHNSR